MNHPPYHLRMNKAIDRLLLIEILDVLKTHCKMSDYTYYGLGGPFLEDCKLIHNRCPDIQIVSIEQDSETHKRQEFHRFSKNMKIIKGDFADFLLNFSSEGKEIFWLDYTDRRLERFNEFKSILGKVSNNSVVKITIRAERDRQNLTKFKQQYHRICPPSTQWNDIKEEKRLVKLLQDMLEISAQQALPAIGESVFQILNSSYYKEPTRMLSVTGIVCNKNKVSEIQQWFKDWKFINLGWEDPHKIDVPFLSIKEKLHLEKYLPTSQKTGRSLSRVLGYKIDSDDEHIEKLKQYEIFYQYYPYFARVSI